MSDHNNRQVPQSTTPQPIQNHFLGQCFFGCSSCSPQSQLPILSRQAERVNETSVPSNQAGRTTPKCYEEFSRWFPIWFPSCLISYNNEKTMLHFLGTFELGSCLHHISHFFPHNSQIILFNVSNTQLYCAYSTVGTRTVFFPLGH